MRGRRNLPPLPLVVMLAILALVGCAPVVKPGGPAAIPPRISGNEIIAPDGSALPLKSWSPESGAPSAVVLALHGFNDYNHFFDEAGAFLAKRGIASYAYDQRGFGKAVNHGHWPGIATLSSDLKAAVRVVRARHPGAPFYLLGESMGGAVILVTMTGPEPPDVDGMVLVAPAVWGRSTMPWYQTAGLWLAAHTLPGMTLSGRGLGIKPSDNIEMLRALSRDPLTIKKTRVDALYGLVNLMDAAMAAGPRLEDRTLILYGERDELVPAAAVGVFLAGLPESGKPNRRVAVYDNGYHMLLRDLQAETVWRDIAAWIADRDGPLPSGADASGSEVGGSETGGSEMGGSEVGACSAPNVCAIVPGIVPGPGTRSSAG